MRTHTRSNRPAKIVRMGPLTLRASLREALDEVPAALSNTHAVSRIPRLAG